MRHNFFDFKYAELRTGKRWYVEYYVKNPETGCLDRKRVYIDSQKSLVNRRKLGENLCININKKLDTGWNPNTEARSRNQFVTLLDALKFSEKYKASYMRSRSVNDYKNRLKKINHWLTETKNDKLLCYEFNEEHAIQLMNHLMMKCDITGRNFNNYLMIYRTTFNLLVKQRYCVANPFQAISKLPETKKYRQAFSTDEQKTYVDYLKANDFDFYIISQLCYYCALRPNEICQLRIKDIDWTNQTIHVSTTVAKNKRERSPVVADVLFSQLQKYYAGCAPGLFICSKGMKPGQEPLQPARISDHFRRVADKLELRKELQFYSLKDTCADRLLASGCDPRVLRDLFDHADLHATDKYIQSRNSQHMSVLKSNFPVL